MPTLTDISKSEMHGTPEYSLNQELIVAGRHFSDKLISANITYNTDVGGSGIQLVVYGTELQDYVNAPVEFWIGYGDQLVPYFVGHLQRVTPTDEQNVCEAMAFGPYRMLVGQILRSQETYIGKTLEYVIMDCFTRAGADRSKVEIRNGRKYTVNEAEQYTYDSGLSDIVSSLLEKADFVGMDMPGGKRLFMPTPRPGANIAHKTSYAPSDYTTFSLTPKDEDLYYSVLVYRRDDKGNYLFRIEQEINALTKFQPPRNKVYVIPDFPGNVFEAGELAYNTAQSLRLGESNFTLTMAINPELLLYDGLKVYATRVLEDNLREEERAYSCTIDGEIQIEYSAGECNMSVSGSAVELVRERSMLELTNPAIQVSPGIIRS